MKERVLITGITGMVGSHLLDFILNKTNFDIFGFARWRSPLENINHHIEGYYLHGIQGCADYYTVQHFGGQLFSFEKFLFTIFPVWIALLILKTLLVSFSTIGSYILLRKVT